jgi:isopentenyl-diphosphate delta-isomerase
MKPSLRFSRGDDDVVVLVDSGDVVLGVAPKIDVHREGRLHRAVSVVLFDDAGRLLLQRRAAGKYHSGGLWSNTCCGHPRPGESVNAAAQRRLSGELGIEDCRLTRVSDFVYYAEVGGGLVEHELDHVLVGRWTGTTVPTPAEVSAIRWVDRETLLTELAELPRQFTPWTQTVVYHACRGTFASRT